MDNSTKSMKLGLIIGLSVGFGILAIIVGCVVCYIYRKHYRTELNNLE